jgi:hypothetical protein
MGVLINATSWCVEVNHPQESIEWKTLLRFNDEAYAKYKELVKILNQTNLPFQVRIAPDVH